MQTLIRCKWRFDSQLFRDPAADGIPLSSIDVTADLSDLVDEAYINGVLADALPEAPNSLEADVEPILRPASHVDRIKVHLKSGISGSRFDYSAEFTAGRWTRTRLARVQQLREEATLGESEAAYHALVAMPSSRPDAVEPPLLQPPPIVEGTLEDFGIQSLTSGSLVPDRPILVNTRVECDSIESCLSAGPKETGAAALGAIVRLPAPIPHTSTPIVTILTAHIEDQRHSGQVNEWSISPDALADSARIAELRGLGESVLTVIHSHGWSTTCGRCNENPECPLAECTHLSLMDYRVLETLFPGKSTLMPIVGRRLGAEGQKPVLAMHAWRGGEMRQVRFMRYCD